MMVIKKICQRIRGWWTQFKRPSPEKIEKWKYSIFGIFSMGVIWGAFCIFSFGSVRPSSRLLPRPVETQTGNVQERDLDTQETRFFNQQDNQNKEEQDNQNKEENHHQDAFDEKNPNQESTLVKEARLVNQSPDQQPRSSILRKYGKYAWKYKYVFIPAVGGFAIKYGPQIYHYLVVWFRGTRDFSPPSSPRPTTSYSHTNQIVDASAPSGLPSEQRIRIKVTRVFLSLFNFTVNFVTFRSVRSWLRPTQVSLPRDNEMGGIADSTSQQLTEKELADLKKTFPGVFIKVPDTNELLYPMKFIIEAGGGLKGLILFLEECYPGEDAEKLIGKLFVPPPGIPGIDFEETAWHVLYQDLRREPVFGVGANRPSDSEVFIGITTDLNLNPWQNPYPSKIYPPERLTLCPSRLEALFSFPSSSSGLRNVFPKENEPSVPIDRIISESEYANLPYFFPGFFTKCIELSSRAEYIYVMQFILKAKTGVGALEELIQTWGRDVNPSEFFKKNFNIPPGIPHLDYLETPGHVLVKDIVSLVDNDDSGGSSSGS